MIGAAIGRVVPIPQGTWSNTKTYKKLDIVYSEGISYIARKEVEAGIPLNNIEYWQIISKGLAGPTGAAAGIGSVTTEASIVPYGSNPEVSATTFGENTAKNFKFDFKIPQGPTGAPAGIGDTTGNIAIISSTSEPHVSITTNGPNTAKNFVFDFEIPQGPQGVIGPTGPTGGVYLPVFDVDFTDGVLYAYQYEEGPHFGIDSKGDLYMELRSE